MHRQAICLAAAAMLILPLGAQAEGDPLPDPFSQLKSNAQGAAASGTTPNTETPMVIPEEPTFDATSWVLMDYATGKILMSHDQDKQIWPASLTKMMTSYVIGMEFKAGRLKPDDDVTITEEAWSKRYGDSSKMFIEVGKTVKAGDLNRGIIIQSGNDACVALAIHLAGSQEGFVSVMNSYAQKLGLKRTHFDNVHGLFSEQNFSTAYDMSQLGRALIRDLPDEYSIYKEKEFTFNGIKQHNRNRLLWNTSMNVDGIKTGHLSEVGYNLVASAERNGMRLIATVIGAKSEKERADFCLKMLNYGFNFFEIFTPELNGQRLVKGQRVMTRDVRMGEASQVDLVLRDDLSMVLPRGASKQIGISYRLKSGTFEAPIAAGEELGKLIIKLNGQEVHTAPLVAAQDIPEGGFFSTLLDRITGLFSDCWDFFFGDDGEEGDPAAAQQGEGK